MSTAIVIPARLASTRFPNKMLAKLNGVPLIKHVYNRCIETGLPTYVVTPDKEITEVIGKDNTILVGDAENGTARCALAADYINYANFINVQGDMPDITADIITRVAQLLGSYDVVTAYTKMTNEQRNDPHSVKVVHNKRTAKWFGRGITGYGDHHLGVYGYRNFILNDYANLERFPEEDIEQLEQLRWIQNDIKIGVTEVKFEGIEINTPSDLDKWEQKTNN